MPIPHSRPRRLPENPERVANALRIRLWIIEEEQRACLRLRDEAYRLADALLDEFDDLAAEHRKMRHSIAQLVSEMASAGRGPAKPRSIAA